MAKKVPDNNLTVGLRGNRTYIMAPSVHVDIRMPRPLHVQLRKIQAQKGEAMTRTVMRVLEMGVETWEEKFGRL